MADIWNGDIGLPDGNSIQGIILATRTVASTPHIPSTSLRFLSTVNTARIPLYLATGPSLDVWTTSEFSQEWFHSLLLGKATPGEIAPDNAAREWWHCARSQSPIGILVQVDGAHFEGSSPKITEILFYGTIAPSTHGSLPTPPSSSPDAAQGNPELPELRVHALPLSSDLLHTSSLPKNAPLSPSSSAYDLFVEPQFLPVAQAEVKTIDSPKRKRDIFEEATQLRKKARRKGGEGVAAAAAKANELQPMLKHRKSLSIDTKTTSFPDPRPASATGVLSRPPSRQLSRSPSICSDSRPSSRKGYHESQGKRSTLSRVETISLQPEEPTTETRNKEALSRVVMAAMRMHGLQQRKRSKSRRGSVAPEVDLNERLNEEAAVDEAAKDEEYKVIYHQTYKGAALALRKHMSTKPLHLQPDRLRDVVEKLLAIFCTDPLAIPFSVEEPASILATPGGPKQLGIPGSSHNRASPFDLPSGRALAAIKKTRDEHMHTGSPVGKKVEQTDYFGPVL